MFEIIDLSQEIFAGMPVFPGLPEVKATVRLSHEELEGHRRLRGMSLLIWAPSERPPRAR